MPGSIAGSQNGSLVSDSTSQAAGNVPLVRPGQEDDLLDERAVSVGIMGVMYTVCKEKAVYGWLFVTFRLLADWLQLWLIVVNPLWFDINPDKLWWQIVNFIQLNQFMAARGYTFFLGCFYTLLIGVVVSVVICVWVGYSFQANRFDQVWPIVFLRWFAKIFYQMLDIMSMTLFLMALDCQYFSRPKDQIYHNQQFPEYYCWGMPHVIHAVVAVVVVVVFLVLAGAFTVGEMELNVTSRNPLAITHTGVELESFILRVLMTLVSVFVNGFKWCSVAQLILCTRLTYIVWYWQPQVVGWVNHVRVGLYASVWWSAVLFVVRAFNLGVDLKDEEAVRDFIRTLTIVLWATFVPAGLLGALGSWAWLRWLNTTVLGRFKKPQPDASPAEVYEFTDSRQVEVLMRCCRVWVKRDQLDPERVALAEAVLACGLAQLPNDPFMIILHSSFLIDVQASYQSGYISLQAAKKADPSFLMRFAIFSREQQHTQKNGSGGNSGGATDLVSYVEFQRNYTLALKVHREALASMRLFWERLLHRNIKFQTLADCVKRVDTTIRQAERVYKQVLSRHAHNVKMVRLYAKFLEQVKHDPWNAARWATEADKLEQVEEESKNRDAFHEMGTSPELRSLMMGLGGNLGNADGRGVVIINAQGIVQMANNGCEDIFGYTKTELRGKNVALLVPPPMSAMHQGFLRAYITTGRTRMMNRVSYQLGLRKDKRLAPLHATITRVSGLGEDTLIMGVMEEVVAAVGTATLWVGLDGEIMSCDDTVTDWLAYTHQDVAGMDVMDLVVGGSKVLEDALDRTRAALLLAEHKQHRDDVMRMTGEEAHMHANTSLLARNRSTLAPIPEEKTDVVSAAIEAADALHQDGKAAANALLTGPSRAITRLLELAKNGDAEGVVGRIVLAHKYAESVEVEVTVTNGGAGAMCYHVLTIKRALPPPRRSLMPVPGTASLEVQEGQDAQVSRLQDGTPANAVARSQASRRRRSSAPITDPVTWPPSPELMLVADGQGRVLHCTAALAKSLGRSVSQLLGNGLANAVESLMAEPFDQLHRTLVANIPISAPPPYSCRSGLAVLMQAANPQGQRYSAPFRLHMRKRQGMEESVNVCTLQQCTLPFALDERRLVLEVDAGSGVVQSVSRSPAALFGFEPHTLVGMSVASCLDIFKTKPGSPVTRSTPRPVSTPELEHPLSPLLRDAQMMGKDVGPGPLGEGVEDEEASEMQVLEEAEVAEKLMELLTRSGDGNSCVSWRVGVCSPVFGSDGRQKRTLPRHLDSSQPRPALLFVRRAPTSMQEGNNGLASAMVSAMPTLMLQLELWRTDLATSVVEVDSAGNVCVPRDPALATLYPPGLVLGAALDDMVEHHVSEYLHPLRTQPLTDLFAAGALGPAPAAPSTRRAVVDPGGMRSLLKRKAPPPASLRAGPQQVVRVRHRCDGEEVEVSVQAVRKNTGGMYILMHMVAPKAAPSDFWARVHDPVDFTTALLAEEKSEELVAPLAAGIKGLSKSRLSQLGLPPHLRRTPSRQVSMSGSTAAAGDKRNVQWGQNEMSTSPLKPKLSPRTSVTPPVPVPSPSPKRTRANDRIAVWVTSGGVVAPASVPDRVDPDAMEGGEVDEEMGVMSAHNADDFEEDVKDEGDSSDVPDEAPELEEAEEERSPPDPGVAADEAAAIPDEAGDHDHDDDHLPGESDYNRAQRFKKLYRVLTMLAVQKPIHRFYRHATVMMLSVVTVHLGLFVLMFIRLQQLNHDIDGLAVIGQAAMAATEVAVFSRTLNMLYVGMGVPGLRIIGGYHDIPVLKQRLINTINTFEDLHSRVYLGKSGKTPQMVGHAGLSQLWDEPSVNITLFADISVDQTGGNFTRQRMHNQTKMVSLWDAGSQLAGKAKVLWQTADEWNQSLANNTGVEFGDSTDLQWIVANAPSAVFPGYLQTMDNYVQVVIDESKNVNRLHIILMVVGGCTVCAVCTFWAWHLLQDVARLRFSMYAVFIVVPQGLVRRLATQKHKLTDDEVDDDDDDDINPKLMTPKGATSGGKDTSGNNNGGGGGGGAIKLHVKGAATSRVGGPSDIEARMSFSGAAARRGSQFWKFLLRCLPGRRQVHASGGRRQLMPSYSASVWLVWPFFAFGALVVLSDALGYHLLSQVPAPIALFNIVSVVMVMYNRNNFYLQEMVFEQDLDKMAMSRAKAADRVHEFELEYMVMLYGREAAPPEYADVHRYQLATKGVVYSGSGNDILFKKGTCLIIDGSPCTPPEGRLYPYTSSGLDRMVQRYIEIGETIAQFDGLDPSNRGPEYEFYWNTRPDFRGGFRQINDVFKNFVLSNVHSVITLHIVILVFILLLCASYILLMMRPFKRMVTQETRRIAELLSHLPSEVDMDALLASTLLADIGAVPVEATTGQTLGLAAGAPNGKTLGSMKGSVKGSLKGSVMGGHTMTRGSANPRMPSMNGWTG